MKKSLRNLNTRYILIAVIVLIVLVCSIPYINKAKSNEYDFGTDHRREYIEQFIDDFDKKYPEYAIKSAKTSDTLNWKKYYYLEEDTIEIIAGHDKDYAITIESRSTKDKLGKLFTSVLSIFTSDSEISSIWNELSNSKNKEMEYNGIKLSYSELELYNKELTRVTINTKKN